MRQSTAQSQAVLGQVAALLVTSGVTLSMFVDLSVLQVQNL